jgi:hypothetical protein
MGVDLPDTINVYLTTCHQGESRPQEHWVKALGLPEGNLHGNVGLSYADNSAEFLRDVVSGHLTPIWW